MNKQINVSGWFLLIFAIVLLTIGGLVGRGYTDTKVVEKEVVKYETIQLPPIHDTIPQPVPTYIHETDTFTMIVEHVVEVDTMAILADYFRNRHYDLDFSHDTIGEFRVGLDITRNMLANATSEIRPIKTIVTHEITISKVETLRFYGLVGTSLDFKTNKVQFGAQIREKYLIGVSGLRYKNDVGYTIDLGIIF